MATSFHSFLTFLFTLYSHGILHVFPSAKEREQPAFGGFFVGEERLGKTILYFKT